RSLAFFLSDLSSGKIVSVPRDAALGLQRLQDRMTGQDTTEIPREDLEAGVKALAYVTSVRRAERVRAAKFNPLFINLPLFDVGPWQPALQRFSTWFVGLPLAVLMLGLVLVTLTLGIRNDWAIRSEFAGILRIETLLTFGLIAPFLKIIHEFGHVVAATAVGVRVRMAALSLIAFYPLPSVDCSEADVTANRAGRVAISLAGIFTDFLVGMVAFVVWHLVEGDAARGVAGQVVVFSTLNSLLFNANPLMKLDGYYAAVDLIGQRSLYTRASQRFGELARKLVSLGADGAVPRGLGGWSVAGYGAATLVYRLTVSFAILSAILPQFLGLGLVLGAWGAYAMFLSPLLADPVPKPASTVSKRRLWLGRGGFLALALVIVALVPLPFTLVLPLRLDDAGYYAVSVKATGYVAGPARRAGLAKAGDPLLTLANPETERRSLILTLERREAELLIESTQSVGLAEAQLAQERLRSVTAQIAVLATEQGGLSVAMGADGYFIAAPGLARGTYLSAGDTVGFAYPLTGPSRLIGAFPERWVDEYQTHVPAGEVRLGRRYVPVSNEDLGLTDGAVTDPKTGLRSINLTVRLGVPPVELVGQDAQIRLHFGNRPIWDHLVFWAKGKLAAFRDAQIVDRETRIEQTN
ncbi:MAG: hypothetical protein B7Z10_12960, partial [Rhodobacterales bacterium 32-66-7]